MRCFAPFGRRQTVGFLTGIVSQAPAHIKNFKSIDSLLDTEPLLTPDLQKVSVELDHQITTSAPRGRPFSPSCPWVSSEKTKHFLALSPEGLKKQDKVLEILEKLNRVRKVNIETLSAGTVLLSPRTAGLAKALRKENLGVLKLEGSVESQEKSKTKAKKALERARNPCPAAEGLG